MENSNNPDIIDQGDISCKNCAAKLNFAPGTSSLKCPYCGTENEIVIDQTKLADALREIDFFRFIADSRNAEVPIEPESYVKCTSCGAETSISSNIISSECPFCGTPLVKDQSQIKNLIKPSALIPFKVTKNDAVAKFDQWMKKGFWAPKKAKQYAKPQKIQGIYTPYWTYDSNTVTDYTGQRGDDYQETESFTNSEGKADTRTVTKTAWTSVSGRVYVSFDDVLVVATTSLPEKYVYALEPWNMAELVPFDKKFLASLKSESYSTDVKNSYEKAKSIMEVTIDQKIRTNIGGDHQQISSKNSSYNDVTFKHVLLPIWLSSYRFNDKIYRFVVNGQSGKVKGERPVSVMKIILVIILVLIVIAALFFLV